MLFMRMVSLHSNLVSDDQLQSLCHHLAELALLGIQARLNFLVPEMIMIMMMMMMMMMMKMKKTLINKIM